MKWLLPILALLLFSCKNLRGEYPDNIYGNWRSLESEKSWIKFDSDVAVVNIFYGDTHFKDTADYIYISASGYGVIPILDEESDLSIIEIRMSQENEQMVTVGEDKDIKELFTYHMVKRKVSNEE